MKHSFVKYLIKKTEDDYNKIASHFSNKRSGLTPDLLDLKQYLKGESVLDFGCGNGRVSKLFDRKTRYLGVDPSRALINIAKKKYPNRKFIHINSEKDIPKDQYDVILCLAVLHHIPSRQYRHLILNVLKSRLKKDGVTVLTVWNLNNRINIQYQKFKNYIKILFGRSDLDFGDIFYPYRGNDGVVLANRYIHVFTQTEIKKEVESAQFKIIQSGMNRRGKKVVNSNFLIIARKKN